MSLFKGNTPTKVVDDTQEVVNDFTRRAPFWCYRPVPYREYEPLSHLQLELDSYLERLFQGELDDANGDVLDNLIFDTVRQACEDLTKQRIIHQDSITSFAIRAKSDHSAFARELSALKVDLDKNLEEQAFLGALYQQSEYKEVRSHA